MKRVLIPLVICFCCTSTKKVSVVDEAEFGAIKIGEQIWMTENLSITHFRNGDPIPTAYSEDEWVKAGEEGRPMRVSYYPDSASIFENQFGMYYNWHAVNDPRGLAPQGWHIPEQAEIKQLAEFLGGVAAAGPKLKNNEGFWEGDMAATNESGFNALPAGYWVPSGGGESRGLRSYWWINTAYDERNGMLFSLDFSEDNLYIGKNEKNYGFSIRCIKN